jgi:tight adherence protein C
MSITVIFFGVLVLFVLFAGAGLFLVKEFERAGRLANRIEAAVTGGEIPNIGTNRPDGQMILRLVASLGMAIARSGLLSRKTLAEMTATLEGAGFRGGKGLGLFIGSKILLAVLVPALAYAVFHHMLTGTFWNSVIFGGGTMLGLLLPESIANNIRKRHLAKVEVGVADALDMLVICADAGLALEAGLARVSVELGVLNGPTSRELQIGSDMRMAMEALGARTGLDTLKRLATTLAQSLQYGTPLTQALRSLSAELRQEALVKFEEKAGRLPTLMTLPMILFILPCVFLVVAGPAIINVLATLHGQK